MDAGNNGTHCHPAYEPVNSLGEGLGIFLVIATVLGALPQVVLIARSKSSLGLSVLSPALTMTYGTLNLCATIIVKWPSLRSCGTGAGFSCILQLLDALQMLTSNIMLLVILLLAVAFPPNNILRQRVLVGLFSLLAIALMLTAFALSAALPCEPITLNFARGLSAIAGITVCVAFTPQLLASYRARGGGSISYLYYSIQASGGVLVSGFAIFALHDSWPVYGPNVIAVCFNTSILVLGAYFRCCAPLAVGSLQGATFPVGEGALVAGRMDDALLAADAQRTIGHDEDGVRCGPR